MREVDSSETSVVWPAWCYSGETVNEDLPQATPASLLHHHHQQQQQQQQQHQQEQQQQQRFQLQQQSSSNQSQPSSSSSSASSSPSSSLSHSVTVQGAGTLSTRRRSSGGKRKSITSSTSPGPQTALTAALGASSVAALATAAAAAAAAAFQASPSRRSSNPPTPTSTSLQLALSENGNGCLRGSPSSNPSTPTHDDGGHYSPLNNNNNIHSSNFNSQVAALQSLDKMLSERMYDRKKFLNSPTAGSAAAAAAAAVAASSFYEKLRNGAAEMELNQLNLIKNGQSALAPSDLSAIGSNNGNSGNSANGGGLLVTANGTNSSSSSSGGISGSNSASVADGNSGNSLSNSNNQNSSNVNNTSSSSSTGSIGNNSNNNSIKSERFSPNNNDVQSTASRSRSVTPSSFSGTPPQTMHATDVAFQSSIPTSGLLPSPNSTMAGGRHEFQARNYSDIMRSLAAKYHHSNNNNNINNPSSNDQSSVKNPFLEPKMRINQPKSFTDNSLVGSKKSSPITSTQVPNPSIMSSLFPGLPFQSTVFPPLLDMSSTQALVALARAAKESGIHNLLKPEDGGLKKPSAGSRSSSPSSLGASLASHFPSPFPPRYLPGILPNHLAASYPSAQATTTAVPAISPLKSPTRPTEGLSTFPLDLSSAAGCAPSAAKRIKLSPTPSRNQETSPAPSSTNSQPSDSLDLKLGVARKCHARIEEISAWTVDNVCDFVGSIDICAEYVQNFRDQSIDGAGLPLLTEEHLTNSLGMKLGPALKLKSMLAKKLGGPCPCALCAAPTPTRSSNKGDTTPTNRPPSNGSVG